jgi:predicted nucleic acid-binding protein
MSIKAVLDANVIYPASIRDTLLRAAQKNLYRIQLTERILEEVRRNLVKNTMSQDKALKLVSIIRRVFNDGLIPRQAYESHIPFMPVNEKDRHVLAAALACKADVIVTQNLKDFPKKFLMA